MDNAEVVCSPVLASITKIAVESLTVTDDIQGDPVSHRTRLNQPQSGCMLRDEVIDWRLLLFSLTNIYRLIGSARHLILAASRERSENLLSLPDPSII